MAKSKATKKPMKQADRAKTPDPPSASESLTPQRVHELFGLPGPYEPPPPPVGVKGFVTWWDPGVSIQSLVKKHRALFYLKDFGERFAKDTDSWKWKQIKLEAVEPGKTFEEQRKNLLVGEPPAARELVTYLILHFLATGERLEVQRLRCRDVAESGRRVIVGPFHELGLDIATVSDAWKSPGIGLAAVLVPAPKKR
jgi:hypothetical protein